MKKKMIYTLITVLALSFMLAVSCASSAPVAAPPAPPPERVEAPPPAPAPVVTAAPNVQRSNDIIIDGAQTYTVVKGDMLVNISKRFYGNGFYFPIIMLASGNVVADLDVIMPGMNLLIPDLKRNLDDSTAKGRLKSFTGQIATINDNRGRRLDGEELRKLANSY